LNEQPLDSMLTIPAGIHNAEVWARPEISVGQQCVCAQRRNRICTLSWEREVSAMAWKKNSPETGSHFDEYVAMPGAERGIMFGCPTLSTAADVRALGRMVLRPTPRSADRARSPARVSQKREYFMCGLETIGDFALRLFNLGA
jgi:hypothetical protein